MLNQNVVTNVPFSRDMLALTKPRITLMTIVVSLGGMCLAPTKMSLWPAIISLFGIALLVSGSSAFNMYIERDLDRLMTRTKNRPLPAGRLKPQIALFVGWALSVLAIPALWFGTNPLTVVLGILSLISYVLIYTPMKQMSSFALVVGAVPGAMPALLGYTAACGKVDEIGIALFAIAFLWQLPHFIAISVFRCDEYTKAGYPVVPAIMGNTASVWLIIFTSLALFFASLSLWWFDVGHLLYLSSAVALGAWFLFESSKGLFANDEIAYSKRVFFASLIYQLALFGALALDVVLFRVFY